MKEKKDCKVIQDLLPNYIENLTNAETNIFIEEHLKECDDCKKILDNMKKEFEVNTTKRDEREVKYIKKYSKKMKTLKAILLIILAIYVLLVVRRTIIMVSLYGKASESRQIANNYYVKRYSYQGDLFNITESYIKGGDYITTVTCLVDGNEIDKTIYYKKGNERLLLREARENKFMLDPEMVMGEYVFPINYVSDELLANMKSVFINGIDKTYCNGKECYIIKENDREKYIDKETGIVIREIEKSNKERAREIYIVCGRQTDIVSDYCFEFNTVKDSDIVRPDTTGYFDNR